LHENFSFFRNYFGESTSFVRKKAPFLPIAGCPMSRVWRHGHGSSAAPTGLAAAANSTHKSQHIDHRRRGDRCPKAPVRVEHSSKTKWLDAMGKVQRHQQHRYAPPECVKLSFAPPKESGPSSWPQLYRAVRAGSFFIREVQASILLVCSFSMRGGRCRAGNTCRQSGSLQAA